MKIKNIRYAIFICFLFSQLSIFAVANINQPHASATQDNPPKKGKIIKTPDIDPMYPGGTSAMMQFISSQLRYPRECVENNKQGLVVYNFVVETDGSLSNFELMHRADSLLNEEALRIIKLMPPWRPAKYKGEFVRARQYVPMYFRLRKGGRTTSRKFAQNNRPTTAPGNINKPKTPINNTQTTTPISSTPEIKDTEVYTIVDQMPQFPSGEEGLRRFIGKFMQYPRDAHEQGVEGRILCAFIVDKEGAISNIEIVKGLYPSLDDEAMRVLSIMPSWKPGINNGERVNVKCILPIDFTIDETPIPPVE